ncbi:MAG: tetratricopeptide repeat protein [Terracidiphilus sp.]
MRTIHVARQSTSILLSILAAILCVTGLAAFCQSATHPSAGLEHDFEQAMTAEDNGDLDRAEALLSKIHDSHPGIFAVDESLGLLLAKRGDASRALRFLKAAIREKPSSDAAHANLGAALYSLHRNRDAAAEFQRAVQLNPSNESAQQSLGRVLMEEQKPADAATALTAALRLSPSDADLQLDCATALLAANRLGDARRILDNFADADNSARAQSLMGEADELGKNFSSAGRHFNRAVELEPSEENAWLLSLELLRHWAFDAAAIELEAASAKFPDSKRMRLGLGAAFFGATKYPQAVSVFADLLESEPDNAMDADLLGISCNALIAEPRPRCETLVRYAQSHLSDARASGYAAAFLLHQSNSEAQRPLVRKLLEAGLSARPQLPEIQYQMGTFLQDDGMWKDSIPFLERAIKLKPDYSQAHYHLALAYWRTGRKQEGQEQMELQKKFSRQEQDDLNQRLRQITTFLGAGPN